MKIETYFKKKIQFGDMVLTSPTSKTEYTWWERIILGVVYFFIRLVSRTVYVHVVMAIGDNKFISFEPPKAKVITLDDFRDKRILVRRRQFEWTTPQKHIATDLWNKKYEGTYYDIFQLVNMLFHYIFNVKKSKYLFNIFPRMTVCSCGFCALERGSGTNTFGNIHTDRVNPGDCRRNKYYDDFVLFKHEKLIKEG